METIELSSAQRIAAVVWPETRSFTVTVSRGELDAVKKRLARLEHELELLRVTVAGSGNGLVPHGSAATITMSNVPDDLVRITVSLAASLVDTFTLDALAKYLEGGTSDVLDTDVQFLDFCSWESELVRGVAPLTAAQIETIRRASDLGEFFSGARPNRAARVEALPVNGSTLDWLTGAGETSDLEGRAFAAWSRVWEIVTGGPVKVTVLDTYRRDPELGQVLGNLALCSCVPVSSEQADEGERIAATVDTYRVWKKLRSSIFRSLRDGRLEPREIVSAVGYQFVDEGTGEHDLFGQAVVLRARSTRVDVVYDPSMLSSELAQIIRDRLERYAASVMASPHGTVRPPDLIGDVEQRIVVAEPTRTVAEDTLARAWARVARAYSARTALAEASGSMTFAETDALSERIAASIHRALPAPSGRVAIMMPRGIEYVTAMVACWKLGVAYVPTDIALPVKRLRQMLTDADVRVVLTSTGTPAELVRAVAHGMATITVDSEKNIGVPVEPVEPRSTVDSEAYVLFTSGTTGVPKGVAIRQGALVALLDSLRGAIDPSDQYTVYGVNGNFTFDTSVKQIIQLLAGKTLYVLTGDERLSSEEMARAISVHSIAVLDLTPSQAAPMFDDPTFLEAGLQALLLGGEAIPAGLLDAVKKQSRVAVFNVYGPTECTVDSTLSRVDASVAHGNYLGQLLPQVGGALLDDDGAVVPLGGRGELVLWGQGLGLGYINEVGDRPNGFGPAPAIGKSRVYRTGDLCWRDSAGAIHFVGRNDSQVKIRGHRVELREIECSLLREADIKDVRVVQGAVSGRQAVVAALVPTNAGIDLIGVREALARSLPEHMHPTHYLIMDALPLTNHGKISRDAILDLAAAGEISGSAIEPSDAAERIVLDIWSKLTGRAPQRRSETFFEAGGDSVLAIRFLSLLKRARVTHITPLEFMKHGSFEALAGLVRGRTADSTTLSAGSSSTSITPIEERFFAMELRDPNRWAQGVVIRFAQPVDLQSLRDVLSTIHQRHDVFRACYTPGTKGYAVTTGDAPRFHIDTVDHPVGSSLDVGAIGDRLMDLLDIHRGPLSAVALVSTGTSVSSMIWITHHLCTDIQSWAILVSELETLLAAPTAPLPPAASYDDYRKALERYEQGALIKTDTALWEDITADFHCAEPSLEAGNAASEVARHISLGITATATVLALGRSLGMSPSEIIGGIVGAELAALLGRAVLCDFEGSGRTSGVWDELGVDLSRSVGWFTSVYQARFEPGASLESGTTVQSLSQHAAYLRKVPHGGETYLSCRRYSRSLSLIRSDVSFNFLGTLDADREADSVSVEPYSASHLFDRARRRRYWLDTEAAMIDGAITIIATFDPTVVNDGLINSFFERIRRCVSSLEGLKNGAPAKGGRFSSEVVSA